MENSVVFLIFSAVSDTSDQLSIETLSSLGLAELHTLWFFSYYTPSPPSAIPSLLLYFQFWRLPVFELILNLQLLPDDHLSVLVLQIVSLFDEPKFIAVDWT